MALSEEYFDSRRALMVEEQLKSRGIDDEAVLAAMGSEPRHLYVPDHLKKFSYDDAALPLGNDQTISQPFIVGLMLQELDLSGAERVLEIGTGSGYQTALLSALSKHVFTVELDNALHGSAKELLARLKHTNVSLRCGDGYQGWSEEAPFDRIIVSAAPAEIPRELLRQLKADGKMMLPLGEEKQCLIIVEKTPTGLECKELGAVKFVPMRQIPNEPD